MDIRIEKEEAIISFENGFSEVVEYLGAKKGIINTTVPYLSNGIWSNLLYEIAYYELDLEHTYSVSELDVLVKTGKVILLSSKPYICIQETDDTKEEYRYALDNLTTLQNYNSYDLSKNSKENNELVLGMLKKHKDTSLKKYETKIKRLENK